MSATQSGGSDNVKIQVTIPAHLNKKIERERKRQGFLSVSQTARYMLLRYFSE